jgi:uncharacterized protein
VKRKTRLRAAATLLLIIAAAACDRETDTPPADEYMPLIRFASAPARIVTSSDTFQLTVDIAERDDQRAYGLMERSELGQDEGMVFLYAEEQDGDSGFWMYRTRIPLDIAFYDRDGRIVQVLQMEPCPHVDPRGCRTYPPGVPYWGALEVNRGYFAQRGIDAGDQIIVDR